MTLDRFHLLVGQTIMYCQIIEHDVKRIYAAMHVGDYYDTLDKIERWTLGQTVQELRALDHSVKDPYISASDYNFLKQMTEKRNHWCHEAYQSFVYEERYLQSQAYADECARLERDNKKLAEVCRNLEDVRVLAQHDFRGA